MITENHTPEEIPYGNQFTDAVGLFNQKAAGILFPAFFRAVSCFTEPLYRREMGERYFLRTSSSGLFIWLVATLAALFTGSLIPHILRDFGFHGLASLLGYRYIGVIATGGIGLLFLFFVKENEQWLKTIREDGKVYHSMSKGRPRWEDPLASFGMRFILPVVLFAIAPVTGILFGVSRLLVTLEASRQQAILYDKYLDKIDSQVDAELLGDAMLGKHPVEDTYLYKPLPANMKKDLRENIAAAVTRRPAKVIAGETQNRTASSVQSQPPSQTTPLAPSRAPATSPIKDVPVSGSPTTTSGNSKVVVGLILLVGVVATIWAFSKPNQSSGESSKYTTSSPVASQNAASEKAVTVNNSITGNQAGSETKSVSEPPKTKQDVLETIRTLLENQEREISEFKSKCTDMIAKNDTKITERGAAAMQGYKKQNDAYTQTLQKMVEMEKTDINLMKESLDLIEKNELRQFQSNVKAKIRDMQQERQAFETKIRSLLL